MEWYWPTTGVLICLFWGIGIVLGELWGRYTKFQSEFGRLPIFCVVGVGGLVFGLFWPILVIVFILVMLFALATLASLLGHRWPRTRYFEI